MYTLLIFYLFRSTHMWVIVVMAQYMIYVSSVTRSSINSWIVISFRLMYLMIENHYNQSLGTRLYYTTTHNKDLYTHLLSEETKIQCILDIHYWRLIARVYLGFISISEWEIAVWDDFGNNVVQSEYICNVECPRYWAYKALWNWRS